MNSEVDRLSPYPEGSLRELWAVALPLMLSALSGTLMLFLDRIVLAKYSTNAMNAAVIVGMLCAVFQFGGIGISSIAEVFVGQHNGANNKKKLGEPAWQMIWFSLMTLLVFVPFAIWGGPILVAERYHEEGIPYYQWIMAFSFFMPMIAAISSFFIGQGKTRLVFISTVIGNLCNLFLDIALVFGVKDIIPSMGTRGAAIATVISIGIQTLILFWAFLSKDNRERYGTMDWAFKRKPFWDCLRIGGPNAIGHMIEIAAWALLLRIIAEVSKEHITVLAVSQSIFVLFAFTSDGMQKGVIAVASNFIGAGKERIVKTHILSAIRLQLLIAVVLAIPMIFYSDPIIKNFLVDDLTPLELGTIIPMAKWGLFFFWIFLLLDGCAWIFAGILTAGGDTVFTMIMNAVAAWCFCIVPIYIAVIILSGGPVVAPAMTGIYAGLNCFCFFLRYKRNKWKKNLTTA